MKDTLLGVAIGLVIGIGVAVAESACLVHFPRGPDRCCAVDAP